MPAPSPTDAAQQLRSIQYSPAQTRIITATIALFAEHGVSGTSLQMIADALGVTKAAVYHQFRTKEEIVLAVAGVELIGLEIAVEAAEADESREHAREMLLAHVIDLAVERRRMASALQGDPVMIRLLASHRPFQQLMERVYGLLLGAEPSPETRTRAAMASAAVGGAVSHPLVAELDDDSLRLHLLRLTRTLVDLPERRS